METPKYYNRGSDPGILCGQVGVTDKHHKYTPKQSNKTKKKKKKSLSK